MGWCCQWQSLFGKFGILKKHFVCSAVASLCGLPLLRGDDGDAGGDGDDGDDGGGGGGEFCLGGCERVCGNRVCEWCGCVGIGCVSGVWWLLLEGSTEANSSRYAAATGWYWLWWW